MKYISQCAKKRLPKSNKKPRFTTHAQIATPPKLNEKPPKNRHKKPPENSHKHLVPVLLDEVHLRELYPQLLAHELSAVGVRIAAAPHSFLQLVPVAHEHPVHVIACTRNTFLWVS